MQKAKRQEPPPIFAGEGSVNLVWSLVYLWWQQAAPGLQQPPLQHALACVALFALVRPNDAATAIISRRYFILSFVLNELQ